MIIIDASCLFRLSQDIYFKAMPHNLFSSNQVSPLEIAVIGFSWFVYFILNTCCLFFFVVAVRAS